MEKARDLGERLDQADVVSYALTAMGVWLVDGDQDGITLIEQGLRVALDAHLQRMAGVMYTCIQDACINAQRLEEAQGYYAEGMAFCEQRELRYNTRCLRGGQADTLLLLGQWDDAADICERVLAIPGVSPANRLYPLRILGTIRSRRGEDGARELLDEGLALAEGIAEPKWVAQARAARAELLWLSGRPDLAAQEARAAYGQAAGRVDSWKLGSVAIWLSRLQAELPADLPAGLPEPYTLEMAGDRAGAAAAWQRLGRPYDAALAALGSGSETELRQALAAFETLGARAAAAARRRMKDLGVRAIPRGPRAATRAAPAGLTAREQQVLALLAEGLADREISRRLFISERTVHHHVPAVLAKIGVSSRTAAAREAARLGIGASPGPPA
jgi:DNA-binding CsgD family transcriptional regulator